MSLHVLVVGELTCDIVVKLPDPLSATSFASVSMDMRPSGTALSFARAASSHFDRVSLHVKVGNDTIGDFLAAELDAAPIDVHVVRDAAKPSRIVLVLREDEAHGARRVLLARDDVANDNVSHADLAPVRRQLKGADVLYLDGYGLRREPSASAIGALAVDAAAAGVDVVFDVVPHNLDEEWGEDRLQKALQPVSILIAEANTLLRFIGVEDRVEELDDLRRHLGVLRERFSPGTLLLRFGIGEADQSAVVTPDGGVTHRFTGYRQTRDVTGFGDRLAAAEIAQVLAGGSAGANVGPST